MFVELILRMRNSLCAVCYENTLELVRFGISKTTISSTVWYYTNGDIFVGAEGSSWDSVTIRYAKRFIGTLINELGELSNLLCGSPLVELDDRYSRLLIRRDDEEEKTGPVDVEAEILREIRSHVDKYVIEGSRKLSTVVVGVPARFNQLQWECTLSACCKSLRRLSMLNCLMNLSLPLFIILRGLRTSSQAIIWYTTLDKEPLILLWWNIKEQTVMIL